MLTRPQDSLMKTYVILVNYNNWKDTLFCVWDLLHKPWNHEVIIVDNNSTDDSVYQIERFISNHAVIHDLNLIPNWYRQDQSYNPEIEIHFIKAQENGGFAYGNNLGIQKVFELCNDQKAYVWLLNNDTFSNADTLPELISFFNSGNYGLVGSQIVNFNPPHDNQSFCGTLLVNMANFKVHSSPFIPKKSQLIYPIGASLFSSLKKISKVGLMDEAYFLYYEEIDWSMMFSKYGMISGIAEQSKVYHKQGATTGSKRNKTKKNLGIEKYKYLGILRFYEKHFPQKIVIVYLNLFYKACKAIIKGNGKLGLLILKVIIKTEKR